MEDLRRACGRFAEDLCKICGRFVEDLWLWWRNTKNDLTLDGRAHIMVGIEETNNGR